MRDSLRRAGGNADRRGTGAGCVALGCPLPDGHPLLASLHKDLEPLKHRGTAWLAIQIKRVREGRIGVDTPSEEKGATDYWSMLCYVKVRHRRHAQLPWDTRGVAHVGAYFENANVLAAIDKMIYRGGVPVLCGGVCFEVLRGGRCVADV